MPSVLYAVVDASNASSKPLPQISASVSFLHHQCGPELSTCRSPLSWLEHLERAHGSLLARSFSSHELEPFEVWRKLLTEPPSESDHYGFYAVVAYRVVGEDEECSYRRTCDASVVLQANQHQHMVPLLEQRTVAAAENVTVSPNLNPVDEQQQQSLLSGWFPGVENHARSPNAATALIPFTLPVSTEHQNSSVAAGTQIAVLGVATFEKYYASSTLWLAYVVVDESARGLGIAKELVKVGYKHASDEIDCKTKKHYPFDVPSGFATQNQRSFVMNQFFLCAKKAHKGHDVVPPAVRHKLYASLGFVPLALDYYDCGPMREDVPSALAVYEPSFRSVAGGGIHVSPRSFVYPAAPVLAFVRDMYSAQLAVEGKALSTEMDAYNAMFEGTEGVPYGSDFWT